MDYEWMMSNETKNDSYNYKYHKRLFIFKKNDNTIKVELS
jgi:hypothetical protein